jgi:hypothetical protein
MGSTAMYECGCYISRSMFGAGDVLVVHPCDRHATEDPGVRAALEALRKAVVAVTDAEASEQLEFTSSGFEKKEQKQCQ